MFGFTHQPEEHQILMQLPPNTHIMQMQAAISSTLQSYCGLLSEKQQGVGIIAAKAVRVLGMVPNHLHDFVFAFACSQLAI